MSEEASMVWSYHLHNLMHGLVEVARRRERAKRTWLRDITEFGRDYCVRVCACVRVCV